MHSKLKKKTVIRRYNHLPQTNCSPNLKTRKSRSPMRNHQFPSPGLNVGRNVLVIRLKAMNAVTLTSYRCSSTDDDDEILQKVCKRIPTGRKTLPTPKFYLHGSFINIITGLTIPYLGPFQASRQKPRRTR